MSARYEYTVVSECETIDVMIASTLSDVLLVHQATLLYQFMGMAVIQCENGVRLGVKWRILLP